MAKQLLDMKRKEYGLSVDALKLFATNVTGKEIKDCDATDIAEITRLLEMQHENKGTDNHE